MSTPNQPGSDQKSESTSGSTPPKPEQATAPAGPQTSKPAAPADGGPKASEAAPAPKAPEPEPASNESAGPAQNVAGGAQGGGPVRMTTGQIQLLKKVDPVYPPVMHKS